MTALMKASLLSALNGLGNDFATDLRKMREIRNVAASMVAGKVRGKGDRKALYDFFRSFPEGLDSPLNFNTEVENLSCWVTGPYK